MGLWNVQLSLPEIPTGCPNEIFSSQLYIQKCQIHTSQLSLYSNSAQY